eukprot:CAMPEP_0179099596 /NCGR_PEP_ID=MMETSP0796-20121207/45953_1 /TAXON_ID=73915 /ORGANISM="Pyrodinium bahamense, Strain pbaha01" /LENGTH=38 /DNA_ID= /DNA_START= /DNA_END= /DNA_ORIENTATION=
MAQSSLEFQVAGRLATPPAAAAPRWLRQTPHHGNMEHP